MSEVMRVALEYPRINPTKSIEIDLVDVRASDGIRIEYDFNRDGWVIKQASRWSFLPEDLVKDQDWQEVAFIWSWGRQETDEQCEARLGFRI